MKSPSGLIRVSTPTTRTDGEEPTKTRDRQSRALDEVHFYSGVAASIGLVPVPTVDMAGLAAVQLRMLSEITSIYGQSFNQHLARSFILMVLGSVAPTNAAWGIGASLVKAVPVLGTVVGWATMPAFGGVTTYAVGRIFIEHFESGGTFLNFDGARGVVQARARVRASRQS